MKKTIYFFIVILICIIFTTTVLAEDTNTVQNNSVIQEIGTNELQEQKTQVTKEKEEAISNLQYVQDELSASIIQVQNIGDTIQNYQTEIMQMNQKIEELDKSISDNKIKLEDAQLKYNKQDELLRRRLVALYEYGETSYLDLLFSSTSLADFVSNYYAIQQIVETDSEILEDMKKIRDTLSRTKQALEKQENDAKTIKVNKEKTAIALENAKLVRESYIANLSIEERDLNTKIEEYKQEELRIEALIQSAINNNQFVIQYTGGKMIWPVAKEGTRITSYFGFREHPIQVITKNHSGIDIGSAGFGAPVVAALDGIVSYAGYLGDYGNCVMINHGNGITTLYGHGQAIKTELGKEVKQGELIMEVGSTGMSTGPHLHFEVRVNGTRTDPLQFVNAP